MTSINWGLLSNVPDAGQAFLKGMEQGKARRVDALTSEAVNALLRDPSAGSEHIGALAKVAPQNALALIQFQQKQQERQRDLKFREAQGEFVSTFAPSGGAVNALMPFAKPPKGSAPAVGADGGPPLSMAPPPPSDWRETIGPDAAVALATSPANGVQPDRSRMAPYSPSGPAPMDAAQAAQGAEGAPTETALPDGIARAAQSPNMQVRNRAFMEMAKIDPLAAMKIDSEMRDATLDRLEDADKAYRLAVARLPRVTDEASYQDVLTEVDAILQPLGMDIRETVPANYPGPEGTRRLLMQAMDAQQQLAAMDRRFSAEARAADIEADNQRADRNTDSLIADRSVRTGILRQRAETSDRREARIAAGGGGRGSKPKKSGGAAPPTAVNPTTGERIVFRGGKWVPAK